MTTTTWADRWSGLDRRLQVALGALTVLVVSYLFFVLTGSGQRLDNRIWSMNHLPRGIQEEVSGAVRSTLPVVTGVVLLVECAFRRSVRLLVASLVGWGATILGAYGLRHALPRPYRGDNGGFPINSFPSTHVAIAATPLVALLIARGLKSWLSPVYAVIVAAAAIGNTFLLVHRFSDTVGSLALGACLCAVGQWLLQAPYWDSHESRDRP